MRIVIIIILFFSLILGKAQQNLILNPSFEDTLPHPAYWVNPCLVYKRVANWFAPECLNASITACNINYWFHTSNYIYCNTNNFFGYQLAHSGLAHIGTQLIYSDVFGNSFQYTIETKLSKALQKNHTYSFSFYYNFGEITKPFTDTVPLGILFTDSVVIREPDTSVNTYARFFVYNFKPQLTIPIYEPVDMVNWTNYQTTFIAKGGEQYMTVGVFDSLLHNPEYIWIYYDDFSLVDITPDTIDTNHIILEMIFPNVFTPNEDGVNDIFEFENQEDWNFTTQIFNRWGNMLFNNSESESWDGTYKGKKVPEGVYFFIVQAKAIKTGELKVYKGTVSIFY